MPRRHSAVGSVDNKKSWPFLTSLPIHEPGKAGSGKGGGWGSLTNQGTTWSEMFIYLSRFF